MRVTRASIDDAGLVDAITKAAFEGYRGVLDPPSGVVDETVEDVARAIQRGGAMLAWAGDRAVGCARFEPRPDCLYVGRVAVLPAHRRQGVATALMVEMEGIARELGLAELRVGVRSSLPNNVGLYQRLGYAVLNVEPHPGGPDSTIWMTRQQR